jgi:hypothetical protein
MYNIENALRELETLGYWNEAFDAESAWLEHDVWFPPEDLDLPFDTRQMIGQVNAEFG